MLLHSVWNVSLSESGLVCLDMFEKRFKHSIGTTKSKEGGE